jgi:hypothetical protein
MRACRIKGCDAGAKAGQLMCRAHWYQVPHPLRQAINATWKSRDMSAYVSNVREAERVIIGESAI